MTTSEWIRLALSWLGTYALHSTLFLGGAWLLCTFRPPRTNQNRERIWRLGLIGGLLSATLQLAFGARPWLGHIQWKPEEHALARGTPDEFPARSDAGTLTTLTEPAAATEPEPSERRPALDAIAPPRPVGLARRSPERAEEGKATPADTRSRVPSSALEPPHPPAAIGPRDAEANSSPEAARASGPAPALDASPDPFLRWASTLASARHSWPGFVFLGWTGIGLASLLGVVASWTCLRRRMLGRTELREGPLVERLEELRRRAHLNSRVRLTVSPRLVAPFSTGLLRPEICVPTAVLTDLTAAQQEVLLAHELAHLVRRDPAWFGVSFLIEKVFFFQPLNRLARSELSHLAELACDDWAVRWTGARLALASCLTEVAEWVLGTPTRELSLPGLAGQRSRLGRRVMRLLDDRRSPSSEPRTPWWPPLAVSALALAVLAMPGISASTRLAARSEVSSAPGSIGGPEAAPPAALPPPAFVSQPASAPSAAVAPEPSVLEAELGLLQAEIDQLHAELEQRALRERFAGALERIDARMAALRTRQERVRALLVQLTSLQDSRNTPPPAVDSPR